MARLASMGAEQHAQVESLEALEQRGTFVERSVEALEQRGAVERSLDEVRRGLYVVPYMTDPGALVTNDPWGRRTIGFEQNGHDGDTVYRSFEEIFRGPEAFIRDRQRVYLDVLAGREPVLDVGCGRGELLDLLVEAGVEARGVDADPDMVAACVGKGHKVELADGNAYLASVADGRSAAIGSMQVIEHMPYETLCAHRARPSQAAPGGIFVAETVNPHTLHAFKTSRSTLATRRPCSPRSRAALCQVSGFARGFIFYPNGTGDPEADMWGIGEYAIVCEKKQTHAHAPVL